MTSSIYELLIKSSKVIDIGERNVVLATRDYGRGKPRFIINLPTTRNDLWIYLWKNKVPIKVFIELPEEVSRRDIREEDR